MAEEEEERQHQHQHQHQHEVEVHDASPHGLIYTPSTHDESTTIDETSVASPQDVRMQHVLSLPDTHELLRYCAYALASPAPAPAAVVQVQAGVTAR